MDLSWSLLMKDKYKDLRTTIYCDETELKRFRQLIVNSVLATDIMDKDLKKLRNKRWDVAFSEQDVNEHALVTTNRKATIVIEHIIQASDGKRANFGSLNKVHLRANSVLCSVAHTMQHWHVYRKWNEKLFQEMYKAFKEGRADKDPSEFWYKGESKCDWVGNQRSLR